jgi:drug/metabolite transporter (DMT)-like permease
MKSYQGYLYALMAAIFNAMIGIFSVEIMETGLSPYAVAFFKCFIALVMLTSWFLVSGQMAKWIRYLKSLSWQLPIAAFFGIFVMLFFETVAYKFEKVTVVVFTLLGTSVLTTFILSSILDRRLMRASETMSCMLAIAGLALIFGVSIFSSENFVGIFLATVAGIGYGTFLTINPRFKIGSGLMAVNSLMLYGTIYLFVPFAWEGVVLPLEMKTVWLLVFLALLPTIGGFLCTTRALTLIQSKSVQLIELTEPLLSLGFSFFLLGQVITFWQVIGGAILLSSIYINAVVAEPVQETT